MTSPKRVVLLFSDTGGGHRAATEAVQEALQDMYGARVKTDMIDVLKQHAPYPFSRLPNWYPDMVQPGAPLEAWERGYRLSNGPRRARAIATTVYPYVRSAVRDMVSEHPADVVVCFHALFVYPVMRALGQSRPPIITVVTDLVTVHAWWFNPGVDFTLVPTQPAYERARYNHIHPTRVAVTGLPVAKRFVEHTSDKATLRNQLGWQQDTPTALIVGGGEGMGPLGEIATGLANTGLPLQIAVVCGRNEALAHKLNNHKWPVPAHVYGFVRNMPDLMRAADMLITKAGPQTVMEGLNSGLPLILFGKIPGQEDGNVDYVVDNNAGIWAPSPAKVVAAVRSLLDGGNDSLTAITKNANKLARPDAAKAAAAHIGRFLFYETPDAPQESEGHA